MIEGNTVWGPRAGIIPLEVEWLKASDGLLETLRLPLLHCVGVLPWYELVLVEAWKFRTAPTELHMGLPRLAITAPQAKMLVMGVGLTAWHTQ